MFNFPVVFVDIETTGGSYKSSRIIEIALIRYENDQITEVYKSLVNPGSRLPYHITQLTGITNDQVLDAPYFEDIAYDVNVMLEGAVFIAHHVRFDYSFIKRQLEGCGYKINPKLLCSVRLSRALYPEANGHSLQKLIERHSIKTTSRHRAYDDALAVFDFMKIALEQHGSEAFNIAIARQLKTNSLPPNLNESYMENIKDTPGVYVFEDSAGTPIYIGKSVTLRKRVMSHFTQATKLNKEMKLSMNTHTIRTIETGTELEALLLESQMVKEHLPIYNQQLRRVKKQVVLFKHMNQAGCQTISTELEDISEAESLSNIYGVFKTKSRAKGALENIQKNFDLCPKLLGLEKGSGPCFKYQLKKCRGACTGAEPAAEYNERFEIAMERIKIDAWPYKKPIVVQLSENKGLVVDNWSVIGFYHEEPDSSPYIEKTRRSFDIDTYRILRAHLAKNSTYKLLPSLDFYA